MNDAVQCGSVGVVGHSIGGGVGYSTGQYGLACDSIVSATMVLANGDIVHVDNNERDDLLWGIKGGKQSLVAGRNSVS